MLRLVVIAPVGFAFVPPEASWVVEVCCLPEEAVLRAFACELFCLAGSTFCFELAGEDPFLWTADRRVFTMLAPLTSGFTAGWGARRFAGASFFCFSGDMLA